MEYRMFGKTGLKVSVLGYGAMELRRLRQPQATEILNRVLDAGVTYIDTARDYPTSEEKLGKAIAHRRSEFTIATKCGCNPLMEKYDGQHVHIFDVPTLQRNIENSLRLLKTDYIDVWQMHMTTPEQLDYDRNHEAIAFMQKMKCEGKVRAIGVSLRHGSDTEPGFPTAYGYRCIQDFMEWGVFDMMQIVYGGMVRTNEEVISKAASKGLGIKVRGVVKDYFPDFDEKFRAAGLPELLEEGEDRRSFLIRYAFTHPDITLGIIGTASIDHFLHNIAAAERGPLSPEIYAEAKKRLQQVGFAPQAPYRA